MSEDNFSPARQAAPGDLCLVHGLHGCPNPWVNGLIVTALQWYAGQWLVSTDSSGRFRAAAGEALVCRLPEGCPSAPAGAVQGAMVFPRRNLLPINPPEDWEEERHGTTDLREMQRALSGGD